MEAQQSTGQPLLPRPLLPAWVRRGVYLALTLVAATATLRLLDAQRAREAAAEKALFEQLEARSALASRDLEGAFQLLVDAGEAVSQEVARAAAAGPLPRGAALADRLAAELVARSAQGVRLNQVGYALPAGDGADKSGPYATWGDGGPQVLDLAEAIRDYDYTAPKDGEPTWYTRVRDACGAGSCAEDGPGWSEPPYYDTVTDALLAEYTTPILRDGAFAGVAYASFGLERLTDFVKELDLGEGGYAFVVSRSGVLAAYPNHDDVDGKRTLADLAGEDPALSDIAAWLRVDGAAGTDLAPRWIADPMTGAPAVAMCHRLAPSGWGLCTVMLPTEPSSGDERIQLAMAVTVLVFGLLGLALDPGSGHRGRAWAFSTGASLTFSGAIGFVWYHGEHVFPRDQGAVFADNQVQAVEKATRSRVGAAHHEVALRSVPTGLLVTEMLADGDLLKVSGVVWQRLPLGPEGAPAPDDALPGWAGVEVANAVEAEQAEVYRRLVDGELVVGWRFTWSVADQTEDRWYPISERRMTLDLVPATFSEPVLLVPDISGYDLIVPAALPGVARAVELPGWTPHRSSFSFVDRAWPVDFGLGREALISLVPTLRFETVHRLQLINPLVTYLLPEVILFVLMFALLLVTSADPERAERFGLNAAAAIGTYGTLFFIAVLEHISLRDALAASHMVYFEWFFIVTYVGLLLLTLDALLVAGDAPLRVITYGDNLLARLLFWPLLTGSLLVVTVVMFQAGAG